MADGFDPYYKWLGIAPEDQPPNHYRLLGIDPFTDDADVIENAVDQRMAHIRSFQSGAHAGDSQRILNELAAARVCLLQPQTKARYDEQLRARATPKTIAAPPAESRPTAVARPRAVDGPAPVPIITGRAAVTRGRRPRRAGRPPWALIGVGGLAALVLLIVLLLSGDRGGETANTNPGGGQPSRTPITDQRDARSSPADAGAQVSGGKPTPPPPAVVRPAEAGDPVNLLAGIDLSQHAVRGGWRRDRAVLVSPRDTPALLQVPCNVPAAYEVEAEVLQSAGDGSLGLFLVGEGRQFLVLFDSDSLQGGVASGVQFIDGYHCTADGNPTRRFGDCFAFGEPTTLRCVVRPGSVEAFRNGKAWVQFQGDFHRLSIPAGKPNMPSLSLGILTWGCEFRISRLQLRPLPAP